MTAVLDVAATTDPRWADVVERHRSAVFHSPGWLRVLERTYGFELRALIVDDLDAGSGGIPYARIDDLRGGRVACAPFSDFCDPLVSTANDWETLRKGLADLSDDVRLRTLHSEVSAEDPVFEERSKARWHAVDLQPDQDRQWMAIASSARRAVRKSRSEGVTIRRGDSVEDMRSFFELHLRTRKRKYRLLAQPWAFFRHLWDEFIDAGHGSVLLASHGGGDIAGVVFLDWHGTRYYKFNASDTDATTVRPNDLILWTSIEQAIADGMQQLDLGLSDWDQEGLVRYKRKYASVEGTIVFRRSRSAPPPNTSAESALSAMTQLLTEPTVPDDVTEAAGASLYRYFA